MKQWNLLHSSRDWFGRCPKWRQLSCVIKMKGKTLSWQWNLGALCLINIIISDHECTTLYLTQLTENKIISGLTFLPHARHLPVSSFQSEIRSAHCKNLFGKYFPIELTCVTKSGRHHRCVNISQLMMYLVSSSDDFIILSYKQTIVKNISIRSLQK